MEFNSILLSALLHDIGKFWQRAGKTGTHAKLGGEFLSLYVPEKWRNIGAVTGHHDQKMYLSEQYIPLKTIVVSDWLSSWERIELDEEDRGDIETTPLHSIFSSIDIGKGKSEKKAYDLKILNIEKNTIFPKSFEDLKISERYKVLWTNFVKEVEKCSELSDFESYFETLYHLLEKYTWCIPSAAWAHLPDISLFSHLKSTCAIASCLTQVDIAYLDSIITSLQKLSWIREELKKEGLKDLYSIYERFTKEVEGEILENFEKKAFLLIGGDISGVQRFIYSVGSKGAAKGLRGRSLYLQFLGDAMAKYLLHELGLPLTNLLFCGGGNFYILAPLKSKDKLEEIRIEIAKKLLELHGGEIYLALAYTTLGAKDFHPLIFSSKWDEVRRTLQEEKNKRFHELLNPEFHGYVFGPLDSGGLKKICEVCGEEISEDQEEEKCDFCQSLESLAKNISEAKTIKEIILKKETDLKGLDQWRLALSKFGILFGFDEIDDEFIEKINAERVVVNRINDTGFLVDFDKYKNLKAGFGFKFLLNTELKEFDYLGEISKGYKNWAVLRMDVDNLGRIFREGLGEESTISRLSTLSYMFTLYFNGWIHKLSLEHDEYCYGIYSGGDDLFIVCSWNEASEMAREIKNSFKEFTGDNPNLTISAGISISPSMKFPLRRVADMSKTALDDGAKSLKDKDGICFLGKAAKWQYFEEELVPLKDDLLALVEKGGASRGFLQKLNAIYKVYLDSKAKSGEVRAKYDDRYGRWRWLLAYMVSRTKVSKDYVETLDEIQKKVKNNIEYIPICSRWVELLTRRVK